MSSERVEKCSYEVVFTYATLQQANLISHSRVMLRYSRFLFLTIQVY